jgi:hypothetical protein
MQFFVALLALAASAVAYDVTAPTSADKWTTIGPNKFSWNRVSSDPHNFTLVLTNQDSSLLPQNVPLQLAALTDGGDNSGSIQVRPPSTDLPVGKGFKLRMLASIDNSQILAESQSFEIVLPPTANTTSVQQPTGVPATASNVQQTPTGANTISATDSASSPTDTTKSGASRAATTGVFGLAALGALALVL